MNNVVMALQGLHCTSSKYALNMLLTVKII